jgi:hypothetical protein
MEIGALCIRGGWGGAGGMAERWGRGTAGRGQHSLTPKHSLASAERLIPAIQATQQPCTSDACARGALVTCVRGPWTAHERRLRMRDASAFATQLLSSTLIQSGAWSRGALGTC